MLLGAAKVGDDVWTMILEEDKAGAVLDREAEEDRVCKTATDVNDI